MPRAGSEALRRGTSRLREIQPPPAREPGRAQPEDTPHTPARASPTLGDRESSNKKAACPEA